MVMTSFSHQPLLNLEKRKNNSPIVRQLPLDPFSSSSYRISQIVNLYKRTSLFRYLLEPFAVIGEILLGQRLASVR